MEKLEEKYLFDGLAKEKFEKYNGRLEEEILKISQNIENLESKISNHSDFIEKVIHVSKNISKYWTSGDLTTKERIQKTVFPSGLVIDPQVRGYLTKNINTLFLITPTKSNKKKSSGIKKAGENTGLSLNVAGAALLSFFLIIPNLTLN